MNSYVVSRFGYFLSWVTLVCLVVGCVFVFLGFFYSIFHLKALLFYFIGAICWMILKFHTWWRRKEMTLHRFRTMLKFFLTQAPLAYFWHNVLCRLHLHRWYVALYISNVPCVECCRYCPQQRPTKEYLDREVKTPFH